MNNTYGTVKPALIDPSRDVDIYYSYRKTRFDNENGNGTFIKYGNPSQILSTSTLENPTGNDNRLPGMYNLSLPIDVFGRKGIYTVRIVPREVNLTILDVGVIGAYPDVRGIVVRIDGDSSELLSSNDNLVGYRVEYYDYGNGGLVRQPYHRIITSNNRCEAIAQNITTSSTYSNGYRFTPTGSLCFITLTPSTSPGFKPNSKPYIGVPGQNIVITNTKFDPVCIEIEMVEHDIETLSIMAEGDQVRNLENGRVSTYNFDGEIYKQVEFATVKNNYTGNSVAEIKVDKSNNIDNSLNINELTEA